MTRIEERISMILDNVALSESFPEMAQNKLEPFIHELTRHMLDFEHDVREDQEKVTRRACAKEVISMLPETFKLNEDDCCNIMKECKCECD